MWFVIFLIAILVMISDIEEKNHPERFRGQKPAQDDYLYAPFFMELVIQEEHDEQDHCDWEDTGEWEDDSCDY